MKSNNNLRTFFLYKKDSAEYIPAPLYYWKVLHDSVKNEAIAFLGLNDPHATQSPAPLCQDKCAGISWVDWNIGEIDSGFMSCCSVEELRGKISFLPDLSTNGEWPKVMGGDADGNGDEETGDPEGNVSCSVDLDGRTGKNPPLLAKNNAFFYPETLQNEKRVLQLGKPITAFKGKLDVKVFYYLSRRGCSPSDLPSHRQAEQQRCAG